MNKEDASQPSMNLTLADPQPVEMDGAPREIPLFDGFETPTRVLLPSEAQGLSADRRRTLRQAELIAEGIHPLTRFALHPDADRTRTAESRQDGTPTCGTCQLRGIADYHGKSYPKCFRDPAAVTHGPATDVRAWWPACRDWRPR